MNLIYEVFKINLTADSGHYFDLFGHRFDLLGVKYFYLLKKLIEKLKSRIFNRFILD